MSSTLHSVARQAAACDKSCDMTTATCENEPIIVHPLHLMRDFKMVAARRKS